MALTKYEVCSLALTELGLRPIQTFEDDSNLEASRVCGQLWDHYSAYLQAVFPWRFNMTKRNLNRNLSSPLNEWKYSFDKPFDLLTLHAIFDTNSESAMPYQNFELFENYIYSDAETLWADFQVKKEPQFWPKYFEEFAVMALAAKLAPILTDKQGLADTKRIIAWGTPQEDSRGGLAGLALTVDAKQSPSEPVNSYPFVAARFS